MDCDFHKDSYSYHQLRCQGESTTKDDLSWLTIHIDQNKTIVQSLSQPKLSSLSADPTDQNEVNSSFLSTDLGDDNYVNLAIELL